MFLLPVLFKRALLPTAALPNPVMLLRRATRPLAVFSLPVALKRSAPTTLAVLKLLVVLSWSALAPAGVARVDGSFATEPDPLRRVCELDLGTLHNCKN